MFLPRECAQHGFGSFHTAQSSMLLSHRILKRESMLKIFMRHILALLQSDVFVPSVRLDVKIFMWNISASLRSEDFALLVLHIQIGYSETAE